MPFSSTGPISVKVTLDPRGGIDDLLADEDLTRPGVLGDPRGEVHRSSVVVALLEQDRPGVQPNVSGRQAGGRYAVYQLEGRHHTGSRVAEVHHHAVTQPLHRPTATLQRASVTSLPSRSARSAAASSPRSYVRRV